MCCVSLILIGCASRPVSLVETYDGPKASIYDSSTSISEIKAEIFVVVSVDGQPIKNSLTVLNERRMNSLFKTTLWTEAREMKAQPAVLKLKATHFIQSNVLGLFSGLSGGLLSYEKNVSFKPEAGKRYVVKGKLENNSKDVWIEDLDTELRINTPEIN
jgi:hypothetical protein